MIIDSHIEETNDEKAMTLIEDSDLTKILRFEERYGSLKGLHLSMDALNNRQIRVSISPTPSLRRKLCSNDPTRCWIWWAIFFVMGKISERDF